MAVQPGPVILTITGRCGRKITSSQQIRVAYWLLLCQSCIDTRPLPAVLGCHNNISTDRKLCNNCHRTEGRSVVVDI